jgi:NitT/TauT family transport system substrate-binding protein
MKNLMAFLAALISASALGQSDVPETPAIRVGLLGIADNIPVLIAEKNGYFRDEGLSINVTVFPGGAAAQPALIAGKIDFLHTNTVSLFLARAQGYDLMLVSNNSVSQPKPPDAARLMVKPGSPIQSVKDLEGKKVAVNTLNNVVWLAVRALIEKKGGDPRKVTFQEVPFPQMIDALMNDRVDAISIIEPFSTIAEGVGYFFTEVDPSLELAGMVALESWVKKNPVTTRKFVKAFGRGIEAMTRTRADVSKALVEYSKMDPALADRVIINQLTTRSNPRSLQVWEDLMLKNGLLKQRVDIPSIVYRTALE